MLGIGLQWLELIICAHYVWRPNALRAVLSERADQRNGVVWNSQDAILTMVPNVKRVPVHALGSSLHSVDSALSNPNFRTQTLDSKARVFVCNERYFHCDSLCGSLVTYFFAAWNHSRRHSVWSASHRGASSSRCAGYYPVDTIRWVLSDSTLGLDLKRSSCSLIFLASLKCGNLLKREETYFSTFGVFYLLNEKQDKRRSLPLFLPTLRTSGALNCFPNASWFPRCSGVLLLKRALRRSF